MGKEMAKQLPNPGLSFPYSAPPLRCVSNSPTSAPK